MNKDQVIEELILGTIKRAMHETVACMAILTIVVFAFTLPTVHVHGLFFYGFLLLFLASGFIIGVNWYYTLSYHLLEEHPSGDSAFWRRTFVAQAWLLWLFPYWYVVPLALALVLFVMSSGAGVLSVLILAVAVVAFGRAIGRNISESRVLEQQARNLFA